MKKLVSIALILGFIAGNAVAANGLAAGTGEGPGPVECKKTLIWVVSDKFGKTPGTTAALRPSLPYVGQSKAVRFKDFVGHYQVVDLSRDVTQDTVNHLNGATDIEWALNRNPVINKKPLMGKVLLEFNNASFPTSRLVNVFKGHTAQSLPLMFPYYEEDIVNGELTKLPRDLGLSAINGGKKGYTSFLIDTDVCN